MINRVEAQAEFADLQRLVALFRLLRLAYTLNVRILKL
jgi:hypothetical protein